MRLLVLLAVGCSAPASVKELAVTSGSDDTGDPAVVDLVDGSGMLICTGSAIDPHLVLTAAHCGIEDFDQFRAGGMRISGRFVHPGFSNFDHDLMLLALRDAAPATLAVDRSNIDASFVGRDFAVVGYGSTSANATDFGQKRRGTAVVTAVGALDFTSMGAPSQPCAGDSGAPALFSDSVVSGVTSHGDLDCSNHAVFARIESDFIDSVTAQLAPASVGERCYFDEQCSGGCLVAADEPKRAFCSQSCKREGDCPAAMYCASDGCRYRAPSPGALGAKCAQAGDCASGVCERGLCSQTCVDVGNTCPAGFSCTNTSGIAFYCLPTPRDDGGCAIGHGEPTDVAAPFGFLALLGMFVRRRRATSR